MRDVVWRMGFTLAALAILVIVGPNISCSVSSRLAEQASGQTPQMRIAEYLAAVAEGERQAVLALWSPTNLPNVALEARREAVIDDLLAYGPRLEYRTLDVVWWRTCCQPAVIDDPEEAGGARVRVAISGENRPEVIYLFDLLVAGGSGSEADWQSARQWAIVDVYPEGAAPLAWTWR